LRVYRDWLASELTAAKRWYEEGLSYRQMGARFDPPRTALAVSKKLSAIGFTKNRKKPMAQPPASPAQMLALAKASLEREVAAAKAEAAWAKPYRGGWA